MTKLVIRCGWCGKYMGTKDGQGVEGETTSICQNCIDELFLMKEAK